MPKLYEIPRGSKIKTNIGLVTFHHLDGMYSFCTADSMKDEAIVVHLSRVTPLKKEKDYYVIDDNPTLKA